MQKVLTSSIRKKLYFAVSPINHFLLPDAEFGFNNSGAYFDELVKLGLSIHLDGRDFVPDVHPDGMLLFVNLPEQDEYRLRIEGGGMKCGVRP